MVDRLVSVLSGCCMVTFRCQQKLTWWLHKIKHWLCKQYSTISMGCLCLWTVEFAVWCLSMWTICWVAVHLLQLPCTNKDMIDLQILFIGVFWNVLTNLSHIIIGIMPLLLLRRAPKLKFCGTLIFILTTF